MSSMLIQNDVQLISKKSGLKGVIRVPGDKSITHRAILFGLLANGVTTVRGWLDAADCRSSIRVAEKLGAKIEVTSNLLTIAGTGGELQEPNDVLDCGNSGTTIRMFSGALVGKVPFACLTGDESLRRRPMRRIIQPLCSMGAEIYARSNDCAPFAIKKAPIHGIEYTLPVASAQVKSAVLIAGCLATDGETIVIESERTRDHTENMLPAFGVPVERISLEGGGQRIRVEPEQTLVGTHVEVPGDMSSAAFLLAAGAIVPDSNITVENVGLNPLRAGFLNVLHRMGANVTIDNQREQTGETVGDIQVTTAPLTATELYPEEIPSLIDELPIIAVLAASATGDTIIRGAEELRVKETDRIHAMVTGLRNIGVEVDEQPDGMIIHGTGKIRGGTVDSFHDHRIAMSFAVAGLISEQTVSIQNWACVEISFPTFLETLNSLF